MKNTTRRNLLARLGAGAAAVTTVAVAGSASAAPTSVSKKTATATVARDLAKLEVAASTMVRVPPKTQELKVHVGLSKKGVEVSTASKGSLGLNRAGTQATLGIKVTPAGVEISGLNAFVNRPQAAAVSRCTITTRDVEVGIGKKAI